MEAQEHETHATVTSLSFFGVLSYPGADDIFVQPQLCGRGAMHTPPCSLPVGVGPPATAQLVRGHHFQPLSQVWVAHHLAQVRFQSRANCGGVSTTGSVVGRLHRVTAAAAAAAE